MRQLHRTASIIAGIYTLIQALLYTVFTIYGCAVYTCLAEYPYPIDANHKASDLVYLSYFKGKCRIPSTSEDLQVEAPSAARTYYLLIAYGIASAVWIPTSTLLVVASVSRVKGHHGAWLYYPWIVTTIILIIMDVTGGVWYGLDVSKTLTASAYHKFIGIKVGPLPAGIEGMTVAPAIIMAAIFGRGIILWLINVILLGVVIQAAREVKKTFSTSEFIRGSAPKSIQRQIEKGAPARLEEPEARWVRVKNEVVLPRLELVQEPPEPPMSPQSPIGPDAPSPVVKRHPSMKDPGSSPVFDVMGTPTGETFPFSQDPNRRYMVNDPSPMQRLPSYLERGREERERDMRREREIERETERGMARIRELERERQDREFQRMRGLPATDSERPWQYVRPTDLNLKPKYDKTMKPRFAPDVPPKPAIPPPDYANSVRNKWDPTNLSRSGSNVGDVTSAAPRRSAYFSNN